MRRNPLLYSPPMTTRTRILMSLFTLVAALGMAATSGVRVAAAKQRAGHSTDAQKVKSKRRRKRCNGSLARRRSASTHSSATVCVKTDRHQSKNVKYAWPLHRRKQRHQGSGEGRDPGNPGSSETGSTGTGSSGTGTGTSE